MSRSFGATSFTTRSPIVSVPDVTASSPAIMRSVVVLPQPEGPTRTSSSPLCASKLAAATPTCPLAYTLRTCSSFTRAIRSLFRPDDLDRSAVVFAKIPPTTPQMRPRATNRRALGLFCHVIVFISHSHRDFRHVTASAIPFEFSLGGGYVGLPDRRLASCRRRRPQHLAAICAHARHDEQRRYRGYRLRSL